MSSLIYHPCLHFKLHWLDFTILLFKIPESLLVLLRVKSRLPIEAFKTLCHLPNSKALWPCLSLQNPLFIFWGHCDPCHSSDPSSLTLNSGIKLAFPSETLSLGHSHDLFFHVFMFYTYRNHRDFACTPHLAAPVTGAEVKDTPSQKMPSWQSGISSWNHLRSYNFRKGYLAYLFLHATSWKDLGKMSFKSQGWKIVLIVTEWQMWLFFSFKSDLLLRIMFLDPSKELTWGRRVVRRLGMAVPVIPATQEQEIGSSQTSLAKS
jgi:hypothetical protein